MIYLKTVVYQGEHSSVSIQSTGAALAFLALGNNGHWVEGKPYGMRN